MSTITRLPGSDRVVRDIRPVRDAHVAKSHDVRLRARLRALKGLQMRRVEATIRLKAELDAVIARKQREIDNIEARLSTTAGTIQTGA